MKSYRQLTVGAGFAAMGNTLDDVFESVILDPAHESYDHNKSWEDNIPSGNFDVAVISTPSQIRREVCEPLLNRGMKLVVEKPLTLNLEDLRWFLEMEKTGHWICAVQQMRFSPKIYPLLGKDWCNFQGWKIRKRNKDYYVDEKYNFRKGTLTTDWGVLAQQGEHILDLACAFLGPAIKVECVGVNFVHNIECEDTAHATLWHNYGKKSSIVCTTAGPAGEAGFHLWGLDEQIIVKGGESKINFNSIVTNAILNDLDSPLPPSKVAPTLTALYACYESMRSKKIVNVENFV